MKLIFNRETLEFEKFEEGKEYKPYYLTVEQDLEQPDQIEVVTLVSQKEKLPLHSDDDKDTFMAVKMFKCKNIDFLKHITFYTEDDTVIFKDLEIKDRLLYLESHIEYEHIVLDAEEKFGKNDLTKLSEDEIVELSNLYDYCNDDFDFTIDTDPISIDIRKTYNGIIYINNKNYSFELVKTINEDDEENIVIYWKDDIKTSDLDKIETEIINSLYDENF